MRYVTEVDGVVTFDNGDPGRPEYDPSPSTDDRIAAVEGRLNAAANASVTGEAAKLRDRLKDPS